MRNLHLSRRLWHHADEPGQQRRARLPTEVNDPSLGMPHQFLQIQDAAVGGKLIAPWPYATGPYVKPSWLK
ncbi:hypothetical protein [Gemmobacter sp. 24YEA27]|uniref:hypothetical protein n=1 Tax=Gemmobacter sp. 24YEA27 TaxID=3040672 RepID=UPI0024B35382|nr:hypothetical protein [Gemmobacter sp. 24YEA27]